MNIKMHGLRCCTYALEIDGEYPNHLEDIIKDPTLEWSPIRCEKNERLDSWERWYEISFTGKHNIYAKATSSSGSGGTWGTLTVFWQIPKTIPSISKGWTDKCK
jgi:hypothetical protein